MIAITINRQEAIAWASRRIANSSHVNTLGSKYVMSLAVQAAFIESRHVERPGSPVLPAVPIKNTSAMILPFLSDWHQMCSDEIIAAGDDPPPKAPTKPHLATLAF